MNNNAAENWVPAQQSQSSTVANDQWVKVDTNRQSDTAWESFKNSQSDDEDTPQEVAGPKPAVEDKVGMPDSNTKQASEAPLRLNKGQSKNVPEFSTEGSGNEKSPASLPKPHQTTPDAVRPPENWLNAGLHSAEGAAWNTFARPFTKNPRDTDEYLQDLEKKHPIASIVGGYAPFILSAPFVPESLVPNIYLRTAAQFGIVGFGQGLNRAKDDSSKNLSDKISDVSKETLKQMSYGPIFAKAQALQILDRPFASALARAGIIGAGTGTMNKVYGDNITEAFKQGGLYAGLSLITESPHLAMTTIGRGLTAHMNNLRAQYFVRAGIDNFQNKVNGLKETGIETPQAKELENRDQLSEARNKAKVKGDVVPNHWPIIDPESPNVSQQVHDAANAMAQKIPGIDKPQIAVATIKLADGTEIHGVSHEDALNKIGLSKDSAEEIVSSKPPEFKNTESALIYGNKIKGNQQAINAVRARMESTDKTLSELKKNPSPTDDQYNEMIQLATKKQLDRESLQRAEVRETEAEKSLSDKVISKSDKKRTYEAGFTVVHPDGHTEFITREQSKQEPFKLPTGDSSEVKGLNESKFMPQEDPIKIVNPDTLKNIKDNAGKIDIALIVPVEAPEIAENLKRGYEDMIKKFVPPDVSEPAQFTAMSMRQWLGINARNRDIFFDAMKSAHKMFDRATKESIIETYTKAERGEKQDNAHLQKIYETIQKALKDKAEEVQRDTGRLQELIENYLPHIWEDPKKAKNYFDKAYNSTLGKIFGKRPLGGSKSFLKQRSINDFEEGIKAGLTPVSWNPVDLAMMKLTEMDRFLMEHRVRKALRARGFEYFLRASGDRKPGTEDWVKIKDRGSDVYKSPMIAIQEAYDEHVMTKLNNVAKSLGIDVERLVKLRGGKAWGLSQRGLDDWPQEGELLKDQAQPGRIKTKFAGPTSVLAHEIGHQIDEMYSGKDRFIPEYSNMILDKKIEAVKKNEAMSDDERKDAIKNLKFSQKRNNELKALADLRYEGKPDVSESFKKYVRKGSEKMAVMLEAYIHAPNKFKEASPELFKNFDAFIKSRAELKPLSEIEPSLVLGSNTSEVYAGGNVIAGSWITHPDAARIIDNYLSPGLRGDILYDAWRMAGNSLIQARLSLSAFHAQFVSNDANISHFAKSLNQLAKGDVKGAFKSAPMAFLGPIGPINTLLEGRKMMESWNGKDNGMLTNMLADLYARGGGRAKMDAMYAIEADKAINKALKEGKYLTGALHTPFWILQQLNRPILEYFVPRMKMGVFANLAKMEIERNPNISHQELLVKVQKAVDTVDDRMGQMVYDNLFINKTLKDLGMGSVQSFGWNIGDVRLFGGGSIDLIKNLNDLRQGKGTDLSYRLAYVLSLPIVMGYYGAIYQYLHTGKAPGQGIEKEGMKGVLKDLYFPRNGGFDPRGQEARTTLASYVKDVYHFAGDPLQTIINKLNPLGSDVLNQFHNRDFYGTKIYNEDDGLVQQLIDRVTGEVKSNLPYSIQNSQKNPKQDIESKTENFFGFGVAPYDINMTSAEKEAYNLSLTHISPASRTQDQADHSKAKAMLRSQYMANKDQSILDQAVNDKVISSKEKRQIVKDAEKTNLQRLTKDLSFEEVFHILNKGNPSDGERQELENILEKKRINKENSGSWTTREEDLYDRSLAMAQ